MDGYDQPPLKPECKRRHDDSSDPVPEDDEDVVAHALSQGRNRDEQHPGVAKLKEDHCHERHNLPPCPGKFHVISLLKARYGPGYNYITALFRYW
jgi:hypothetical protein